MAMNVSIVMKLVDGVTGPIRRVSQAVANASKAMEATKVKADAAFDSSAKIRQAAEGVATFASKARAAVGAAVAAWEPFQAQMARVQALTKANAQEFEAMSELARTLGSTGRFGAIDVARGFEELRADGFSVQDIMRSMPLVIDAAVVSNRSLGEVIGSTAGTMDAFGLGAEEMGRVIDVTSAVALASGASIAGMGEALAGVGRDAVEAGISIERVATMAGLMATKNIEGGAAAGALSTMLKALTKPAGEGAQVLAQLGVSTTETVNGVKQMRDPLAVVTELIEKMTERGVGVANQTRAMTALFSSAAPEIMAMIRASREPGMEQLAEAMKSVTGSTADLAKAMKVGGAEATHDLNGAIDELARTMGETLEPVTTRIIKSITEVVRDVTEWTKAHPGLTKAIGMTAIAVAAVSTALAGLMFIIGTMVAGKGVLLLAKAYGIFSGTLLTSLVPSLTASVAGMGSFAASAVVAAAPFIALGAAIGGVSFALAELAKNWDKLNMSEAWQGIKATFNDEGFLSTIGQLFDPRTVLRENKVIDAPTITASKQEPARGLVEVQITGAPATVKRVKATGIDLEANSGIAMVPQ